MVKISHSGEKRENCLRSMSAIVESLVYRRKGGDLKKKSRCPKGIEAEGGFRHDDGREVWTGWRIGGSWGSSKEGKRFKRRPDRSCADLRGRRSEARQRRGSVSVESRVWGNLGKGDRFEKEDTERRKKIRLCFACVDLG